MTFRVFAAFFLVTMLSITVFEMQILLAPSSSMSNQPAREKSFDQTSNTDSAPVGPLLWSFDHEGLDPEQAQMRIRGDLMLLRAPKRMMLVDTHSFDVIWDKQYDQAFEIVELVENKYDNPLQALIARSGSTISVISLETGRILWDFEVTGGGLTTSIDHNRFIVHHFHRRNSNVVVYDLVTGEQLYQLFGSGEARIIGDSLVYYSGEELWLVTSFDLATGEIRWRNDQLAGYMVSDLDDRIVVMQDQRLLGVDPENGNVLWEIETPANTRTVTDGAGFLFLEVDGELWCIHPQSGEIMWTSRVGTHDGSMTDYTFLNTGNAGRMSLYGYDSVVYSLVTGEKLLVYAYEDSRDIASSGDYITFLLFNRIAIVDSDAGKVIVDQPLVEDPGYSVRLNSTHVAYAAGRDIEVMNLQTGNRTLIRTSSEWVEFELNEDMLILWTLSGFTLHDLNSGEYVITLGDGHSSRTHRGDHELLIGNPTHVFLYDTRSRQVVFDRPNPGIYTSIGMSDLDVFVWGLLEGEEESWRFEAWDQTGETVWSYTPRIEMNGFQYFRIGEWQELWIHDGNDILAIDVRSGNIRVRYQVADGVVIDHALAVRSMGMMITDGSVTYAYGNSLFLSA